MQVPLEYQALVSRVLIHHDAPAAVSWLRIGQTATRMLLGLSVYVLRSL
jgi:hypothetical protein